MTFQSSSFRSRSIVRTLLSTLFIGSVLFLVGCQFFQHRFGQDVTHRAHQGKGDSALDLLLSALDLQREDLGIRRPLPYKDPFLLNKVSLFLNSPLQTISFATDCAAAFNQGQNSLSSILKVSADLMEIEMENVQQEEIPLPEEFEKIPPSPLRQAIEVLYPALAQGKKVFESAFDGLSQEEVHFCKKRIESLLFSDPKDEKLSRHEDQEMTEKAFLLASKIDRKRMLEASSIVALALDRALKILADMDPLEVGKLLKEEKTIIQTPLGEILIGGIGDNSYEGKMPLLLIDIGGNDQYRFEEYSPFSVIIDLSGNDTYQSSEYCPLGAGVIGMGFLVDLKGDDLYLGEDFAFGAGFFGVGLLLDRQGNDRYISGMFSQGAGAIGLGLLIDLDGNDHYQSVLYSQGFGSVGGGGFLLDYRGNDTFFAGGVVPDFREKSGAFQTFSQGFGLGLRPFASGGLGILYNGEGNDTYEGSYFCQGSAYWLSIGMLIDGKGNDLYKARRYSQGAGTHWAIGALIDYEGDDHYSSWGVSQGCGHDYSIGILWDGQGNDHYSAEWLSQGAGNDSGRGLLIDEHGNDLYEAGTDGTQGEGKFDTKMDEGSLGLLVDGSGKDAFSGRGRIQRLWKSGCWGGGIDYKGDLPAIWKEPFMKISAFHPPVSIKSENKMREKFPILPELEEPLETEESWIRAAEALSRQGPSVIPALLRYLEIKDVAVQWTVEEAFKKMGKQYLEEIHLFTEKDDMEKAKKRFLLYLLGEIGDPRSKRIFLKFLNEGDSSLRAMALRGFYKLQEVPQKKDALRLSKSEDADVRKYLALSLQNAQNPGFIPLLRKLQGDEDFNVRFASLKALR